MYRIICKYQGLVIIEKIGWLFSVLIDFLPLQDKLVAISRNTRSTVVGIVFVAILAIAYFSAN